MKPRITVLAWLATLAVLLSAPASAEIRKCCTDEEAIGAEATPLDDSVTNDKMADDDFGDWSCVTGACTLDANTVATAEIVAATILPSDMNRWAPIPLVLCPPGMADAATPSVCATMTNQGAGPSSLGTGATMQWSTSDYKEFRLYAHIGTTGAVTGDLILRCDTSINMGTTPTTMVTISEASLVANTIATSAWTAFSADECFGDDVYFNVAMTGGDGAEDPVFRRVYVAFR